MSYDPTNENEALDPAAGLPADDLAAGAPEPPPPPPAADPLFDDPGYGAAPGAAATPRATTGGVDKKTLIGAGVGAAVIALGAVVGINLASSGAETTNTAATGPAGMTGGPGQMGQMPGDTQDGTTDGQSQGQTGQMPGGMQGGGGMAGSTGTIEDIGDGSLTIATEDGESVEVTTTDDTEVSISETGSADDIDEGDTVMVMGQSGDDGSVTAERVVERSGDESDDAGDDDQRGPGGGMGGVTGEVSSVDGDSFVVATDSGDITVTMTDDTTVVIERSGSVDDLSEGDEVFVHTHESDDGGAWAERIMAGDALPDGGMMGGMGGPPSGMQGGPSGESGTMTPPDQGGTDSSGTSGTTGGAPGADAGPSGVTTT